DSSKFDSKQTSAGFNVSLCIPPVCYGASTAGLNVAQSKIKGDFLSVIEQSGIKAGDGGFQVSVGGNTDLKGGVLSSSQAAIERGLNGLLTASLTASELHNKDEHDASGFALSGSVSGNLGDQSGAKEGKQADARDSKKVPGAGGGFGSDSGSQSSVTRSGISGGVILITDQARQAASGKDVAAVLAGIATDVTTENAASQSGVLAKDWDAKQLQKEVDAQIAITQEFSRQAPKQIAKFADEQRAAILAQGGTEEEANKWGEGGVYRVALHAVSGGLTGGLAGAAGSAAVASGAKLLNTMQDEVELALRQQGLSADAAKMLAQGLAEATSLSIGAVAGGGAGAAAALGTDTNNRQLHPNERKWAKDNAKKYQQYLADKMGESISAEDAYQRLLSAGYAIVDNAAQKGGKSDVSALQYISENKTAGLFFATAAERTSPFLSGNTDGSWSPEMAARFGQKTPGESASRAVTKAIDYLGKPCGDNCGSKFDAIAAAIDLLEKASVLYQDDPGSINVIDRQINQLKAGITQNEIAKGAAQSISEMDKAVAEILLSSSSRVVAKVMLEERLNVISIIQELKDMRLSLPSSARNGGNMGLAQIEISGLPSRMAASSKIETPTANQFSNGFVGRVPETFPSFSVPISTGDVLVDRAIDSEAKILNNIAIQLGDNFSIRGKINLLTERPPCPSCSSVIDLFRVRYPNITLNIFDNNGVVLRPPKKGK
ncbi:hypothetical protein H7U20_10065, partial [Rugamonas sp. CCM 8940]